MTIYTLITSINGPTKAVKKYIELGARVVVIGDRKSPCNYDAEVDFLDLNRQAEMYPELSASLPYNHYCRKNLGYVYLANNIRDGDFIYETDDDNVPYDNWSEMLDFSTSAYVQNDSGWVNIYEKFTNELIWPRGLPLAKISEAAHIIDKIRQHLEVGVVQGLADLDPDVDAIHRLVFDKTIKFSAGDYSILPGTFCPFNSQNTVWNPRFLCLAYLPTTVTFRYTDILRSMVAQRILWSENSVVKFCGPSVFQERNTHDLTHDFKDEVPMHLNQLTVAKCLGQLDLMGSLSDKLRMCYQRLVEQSVCDEKELQVLDKYLAAFK